jgi:hypothetical protein
MSVFLFQQYYKQGSRKLYSRVGVNYNHMKNKFLSFALVCLISLSMASCYTVSYAVGSGSQTGETIMEKNHYLIAGLAPIKTANPTQMAGDAKNYQVTISHTVVDGLINILTGGLYTPTTTIVKK